MNFDEIFQLQEMFRLFRFFTLTSGSRNLFSDVYAIAIESVIRPLFGMKNYSSCDVQHIGHIDTALGFQGKDMFMMKLVDYISCLDLVNENVA